MPPATDQREVLVSALAAFGTQSLPDAARGLFAALGYSSDRRIALPPDPSAFLSQFERPDAPLNRERAAVGRWESIHLLFQLSDDDLANQGSLFASAGLDAGLLRSYLFFAIRLRDADVARGRLAAIARAVNRLFSIPVLVLFSHGDKLSIAIINRRVNKRDTHRDVLEKVSLIKDIVPAHPHRGHLDVLASFSLPELSHAKAIRSFDDLHAAWSERLNIELLNRRFYQRIQEWFFWAVQSVRFPNGGIDDEDQRNRIAVIRMLTRIVFCWFARQKGLVPAELFTEETARRVLKDFSLGSPADPAARNYYLAILQNLFFPTLAVPLDQREFRNGRRYRGVNKHYMDHRFYRHEASFRDPEEFGRLFECIPFLNGGLFECLDYKVEGAARPSCPSAPGQAAPATDQSPREVRVDGFSDEERNQPVVPNALFFGHGLHADLSAALGSAKKTDVRVDGLFAILDGYTFTVTENTPVEEEIALDPELLGRIFENLLAEYNPETRQTARKQTGAFYTPRAIVDYMVGEALKAHLGRELARRVPRCTPADARAGLDLLFAYTEKDHPFDDEERIALVDAVYELRTFDPACGSGAFPIGVLQKLVFVLEKLDVDHRHWKARILADTPPEVRHETRALLERSSAEHNWKLALIQHSIYGADIQPIAVQIAKLRCFIALLVDFKVDAQAENRGVPALPNLDFNFVAANSLIPAPGGTDATSDSDQLQLGLEDFFGEFAAAAKEYFYVRDPQAKKDLRARIEGLLDRKIRERESALPGARERAELAAKAGTNTHRADQALIDRADREVALWESYRNVFAFRNAPVAFFDIRYFFPEVGEGFHVTVGNPPYVRADEPSDWNRVQREAILASKAYETLWEKWDLFVPFIERAFRLLRPGGVSTLIVSDAFCHSKYAQKAQNWLLQHARILRLDFCGDLKIFDAAVHNLIYFFQKEDPARHKPERRLHTGEFGNVKTLPTDLQPKLTYRAFSPETGQNTAYGVETLTLENVCYISKGMVVHADERQARGAFELKDLVSESRDDKHPRPFVEGKDLDRWLPKSGKWLEWGTLRAPNLFSRPTFVELYAVPEKLISVDMSGGVAHLKVVYDDQQLMHNHSAWSFVPWHLLSGVRNNSLKKAARYAGEKPPRPDLPRREELEETSRRFAAKYLLSVMNSTVAHGFLRSNRRSNIHLYPDDWKKLPIPDVSPERQAPLVAIVDRILAARRAAPTADIAALESELDGMVSALYAGGTGGEPPRVDVKDRLKTDALPALVAKARYFHIGAVRGWLKAQALACEETTLKQYMSELMSGGFVYDAGKGWYSTLANAFVLDGAPVTGLVETLVRRFPLLRFACWSTEQLAGFAHHVPGKFVAFVETGADAMMPVFEALRAEGWTAYLNPGAKEARTTFAVRDRTVVVRSSRVPDQLPADHRKPVEEVLLDLRMESKRLSIMDLGEYETLLGRVLESGRVNVAALGSWAVLRKMADVTQLLLRYTIQDF